MSFINGCNGISIRSQAKTYSPTKNSQTIEPDSNYNAFSQFTLNAVSLQNDSVNENGTFLPDDNYVGFESVRVEASENALISFNVPNSYSGSPSNTYYTRPCNFELQIPIGEHLTLPTTILMYAIGSFVVSEGDSTRYGYDCLAHAIWTKNTTDDGYIGVLYGGWKPLLTENTHDDLQMSPPAINVPGTISTNESGVFLSFRGHGINSDPSTSKLNPTIDFGGSDNQHIFAKYDIISIWNQRR